MPTQATQPIPAGMHSLTPHLTCAGAADAIEFYKKAFSAIELSRLPGSNGKLLHAMLKIGDSAFMLNDEFPDMGGLGPKSLKGTPVTIHVYVADADAAMAQAVAAGATVKMPLANMFWGDRYGIVEDPFGHLWSVATHQRDVPPEEMQDAMKKMRG
jgi:PhnB protein